MGRQATAKKPASTTAADMKDGYDKMLMKELAAIAKKNNIDLKGKKLKVDVVAAVIAHILEGKCVENISRMICRQRYQV